MNSVLGIHEHALLLREKRSEVLASNLVNADTPNYKARDVDFKSVLNAKMNAASTSADTSKLVTTQKNHFQGLDKTEDDGLKYQIPTEVSFDGNTVDSQLEHSKFTENSMQYLASLNFVNAKVTSLLTALKGD